MSLLIGIQTWVCTVHINVNMNIIESKVKANSCLIDSVVFCRFHQLKKNLPTLFQVWWPTILTDPISAITFCIEGLHDDDEDYDDKSKFILNRNLNKLNYIYGHWPAIYQMNSRQEDSDEKTYWHRTSYKLSTTGWSS